MRYKAPRGGGAPWGDWRAVQKRNWGNDPMKLNFSNEQHRAYMDFTDTIGREWVRVFEGDTDFYDAAYWDLLTSMWRARTPVRKTDALKFMTGIKSAHTAGKYLDVALQKGLLIEQNNPKDARSKLLTLSADLRGRLDAFFDLVLTEMRKTCALIDGMG